MAGFSWQSPEMLSFRRQMYACAWVPLNSIVASLVSERESKVKYIHDNTNEHTDMIQNITYVAEFIVSSMAGLCMYYIGRKKTLIIFNVMMLFGWVLLLFKEKGIYHIVGNRLAETVSLGNVAISYVYVTEVSHTKLRAFICGFYNIGMLGGSLIGQLGPPETYFLNTLTFIALLSLVLSIVLSTLMPETPYWLAMSGQPEAAEEVLLWLRGNKLDEAEANELFEATNSAARSKKAGIVANVCSAQFGWCLLIVTFMFFADCHPSFLMHPNSLQLPLDAETNNYFYSMDEDYANTFSTRLTNKLHFFGAIIFCDVCLLYSRRFLYMSTIIISLALLFPTFILSTFNIPIIPRYVLSFKNLLEYAGMKQIQHILPAEIFPAATRDLGVTTSVCLNRLMTIYEKCAMSEAWMRYHSAMVTICWTMVPIGLIFTFFYMPETRNKSLLRAEMATREVHDFFDDLFK